MRIYLTILLNFLIFNSYSQDSIIEKSKPEKLEISVNLKTSQLWKGGITTDMPLVTSQISYGLDKNNSFKIGVWGGTAFANNPNGTHYQEIDCFLHYSKNGFTVELWDFFNSTNINPERASTDIFNYSRSRTAHLFDLGLAYKLQGSFPLIFEADIMVYGGANAGEVLLDSAGNYLKNKYSTMVNLNYPFKLTNYHMNVFFGGAFAINPGNPELGQSTHLFGNGKNKFDIVNVGFTVGKDIQVFNTKFPISLTTLWNPSRQFARIQFAVKLI